MSYDEKEKANNNLVDDNDVYGQIKTETDIIIEQAEKEHQEPDKEVKEDIKGKNIFKAFASGLKENKSVLFTGLLFLITGAIVVYGMAQIVLGLLYLDETKIAFHPLVNLIVGALPFG